MLLFNLSLLAATAVAIPFKRYDNSTRSAVSDVEFTTTSTRFVTLTVSGSVITSPIATLTSTGTYSAGIPLSDDELTTITQYKTITRPGTTETVPTGTTVSTPDETTITQYQTVTVSGKPVTLPVSTETLTPEPTTITQYRTVTVSGYTSVEPTNTITTDEPDVTSYITQYVTVSGSTQAELCVPVTVTTTETTTTTTTNAPSYSTYLTTVPVEAIFTLSGLTTTLTQNYTLTASVPVANSYGNFSTSAYGNYSSVSY